MPFQIGDRLYSVHDNNVDIVHLTNIKGTQTFVLRPSDGEIYRQHTAKLFKHSADAFASLCHETYVA